MLRENVGLPKSCFEVGHASDKLHERPRSAEAFGPAAAGSTLVTLHGHGVHVHTLPSLHVNHQGRSCDPISCEITVS